MLVYAALCFYLYWTTPVWWFLVFATPALLGLGVFTVNGLIGILLLAQSRQVFEAQGVRCLVVYSESPLWEEYIRDKWLSRLGRSAATLNWSNRSRWPPSIEVRLFKHFINSSRNFNPSVMVFRGLRRPRVYRFFYAFQQAKHGRTHYLNALETELFMELGL